jgi:Tol biopolymer transport system component
LPGWQIVVDQYGIWTMPAPDPSGTSRNPSVDKRGQALAFESAGDLTSTGVPGIQRVYVRDKAGTLQLASRGLGSSGNAMMSPKGVLMAFESTSHPVSGADTGVSQIWVWSPSRSAERVTTGAGDSIRPIVSDDGRLIAFTSTADLAGAGQETGIPQVFVYDYKSATFARLTNEPGGCTRPAVAKVQGDWRVTFVCGGQAFYHMLRTNLRYQVQTVGGTVQSVIPEMGVHFLMLSTNADLLAGSGSTIGNRIYMVNLYARPAVQVPGGAIWFPYQGIPGF